MTEKINQLIQIVATVDSPQEALDLVVANTKKTLHADVCSLYLLDAETKQLELSAHTRKTTGLVGSVKLPIGQGMIGQVANRAEPIRSADAPKHTYYQPIPALNLEAYKVFLGVPIVHHRRVLGVLVVRRDGHPYSEEDEAVLLTLSVQLAEQIAQAKMAIGDFNARQFPDQVIEDITYQGVNGSGGVAIGKVAVIAPEASLRKVPDKRCQNILEETISFEKAVQRVRRKIKVISRTLALNLKDQELELFEIYMRMLDDNALSGEVIAVIETGQWAQGALRQVVQQHVKSFERMEDSYLRERATDIKDLGRRVLSELQQTETMDRYFSEDTVLVAEEVTAPMLAEVPTKKLKGIVSVKGSENSHAAILARSMGVPTIMGAQDFPLTKMDGQEIIINGYLSQIYVNPSSATSTYYQQVMAEEASFFANLNTFIDKPAQTTDGHIIPLHINTSLATDIDRGLKVGADGVGLYRTEVPFILSTYFPAEQKQVEFYRSQLQRFAPKPVTIRTLDIGGDKPLPYFPIEEDNPFLGWRGIRFTLDHQDVFLTQLRALLLANEGLGNLQIMLPMITHGTEIEETKQLIQQAYDELRADGYDVTIPPLGIMIEVPATIYQINHLAKQVDFMSVGSNDLTQYLLAVDRNNPHVAELYKSLHPSVLIALQQIASATKAAGIPLSLCGELACDPAGALLSMAMGYDTLSMNITSLLRVKSAICAFSLASAQAMLEEVLQLSSAQEVEAVVASYMKAAGLKRMHSNVVQLSN